MTLEGHWDVGPSGTVLRWRHTSGWWGYDVAPLDSDPEPPPTGRCQPPTQPIDLPHTCLMPSIDDAGASTMPETHCACGFHGGEV